MQVPAEEVIKFIDRRPAVIGADGDAEPPPANENDGEAESQTVYVDNPASKVQGKVFDQRQGIYVQPEELTASHPTAKKLSALARRQGMLYEDYHEPGATTASASEIFDMLLSPLLPAGEQAPPHALPRLFPPKYLDSTVRLGETTDIAPFPVALNTRLFPVGLVVAVAMIDHSRRPSVIPWLGSPVTGGRTLYYIMQKMQPLGETSGEWGTNGYYAAPASNCVHLHLAIMRVRTAAGQVQVIDGDGKIFSQGIVSAIKATNPRWRLAWMLVSKQYPKFLPSTLTLQTVNKPTPGNDPSLEAASTPEELRNMAPVMAYE